MTKTLLLLDTHVWLWSQLEPDRLRPATIAIISEAAKRNAIFIAVISIWETALLERAKEIQLQGGVSRWCQNALQRPGIHLIGLSPEIALESVNLPAPMHKDPSDRILVATARVESMTLVTADKLIRSFAKETGLAHLRA